MMTSEAYLVLPLSVNPIHEDLYFLFLLYFLFRGIWWTQKVLLILLQKVNPPRVSFHVDPKKDKENKKLVIMFSWLFAKEKHIEKYRQLWFGRDYDVLLVGTDPANILLPTVYYHNIYNEIYRFLEKSDQRYEKIMLQSFSIGSFNMFNFVRVTLENENAHIKAFRNLLKGWILDSPAYPTRVSDKISKVVLPKGIARMMLKLIIFLWLQVSRPHTLDCYRAINDYGFSNPHQIPGESQ